MMDFPLQTTIYEYMYYVQVVAVRRLGHVHVQYAPRRIQCENYEFFIKNEAFCIKITHENQELCIKNEELHF